METSFLCYFVGFFLILCLKYISIPYYLGYKECYNLEINFICYFFNVISQIYLINVFLSGFPYYLGYEECYNLEISFICLFDVFKIVYLKYI